MHAQHSSTRVLQLIHVLNFELLFVAQPTATQLMYKSSLGVARFRVITLPNVSSVPTQSG